MKTEQKEALESRVGVRLSGETRRRIRAIAEERGLDESKALREIIEAGVKVLRRREYDRVRRQTGKGEADYVTA